MISYNWVDVCQTFRRILLPSFRENFRLNSHPASFSEPWRMRQQVFFETMIYIYRNTLRLNPGDHKRDTPHHSKFWYFYITKFVRIVRPKVYYFKKIILVSVKISIYHSIYIWLSKNNLKLYNIITRHKYLTQIIKHNWWWPCVAETYRWDYTKAWAKWWFDQ
jgi:hypothetical protein